MSPLPPLPDEPKPADPNPRNIATPDLGGSFEENGQRRLPDGLGAGPGLEVLDEALNAAEETERNSNAGS